MYALVNNKIYVYDPTPAMLEWCRIALVLDNPDYIKKQAMGLWTGNMPRQFHLCEKTDKYIAIPFGCLARVHEAFPGMPMKSRICPHERVEYGSCINLYGYQKDAVEAILEARNGVLVMPCGAGKTQTALEAIARIGMKALWLTHTQDLLTQSMARAKAVLRADASTYGTITAGKVNIGSGITFATVQTMCKIDLAPYKDEWGVIVTDEVHRAVGSPTKATQFYKVLSALSCRYKIGVTATPKRSDGMSRAMFALVGDIVHEVSREEVANTTCPVEVAQVETNYVPDTDVVLCGDGTINYAGLVRDLVSNTERFDFVAENIEKYAKSGSLLVLGSRVEYLERLNQRFSGDSICLSSLGNSKKARMERKNALNALNNGEIKAIFCTYQLAAEGLDCPNLRYVIFATPEKDSRIIEQATGRVARKADGKVKGTVIDFVDKFGMYIGWAKRRNTIYKKLKFTIKNSIFY